uniref:Myosin-6-like n=1 Tax=Saccoglossus kowalevskii TaxID=10224 RepID=A0ABM0MAA3_SACKO|nr:PREDICTED: myosin-6-like [Saccoglossus kowalevskii]
MRKGGYFSAAYNAIRGSEDKELRNLAADTFFYNFDFLNVKLEKLEQSQIDIQATSEEKIKEKDLIIEGLHGKLEKLQKSMIVMQDTLEEKIKEKESEIVQLNRKTSRMKEEQEKALKESQDSYKKKIDELKENNDKLHQDLLNQLEQLQTPTQERGQNECASLSDENNASLEAHDGQRRHTGNFQPASTLPLTADQVDCAEEQGTIGDMHINHLKLKMKHKLYNELNLEIPGSGCGYQHLAEHLGMPPDEIMYLTQNNNPARAVLEWWSKSKETTISNLHKYLIKIGYTMLAKELADYYNLE